MPEMPEGSSWSWFGKVGVYSEFCIVFMDSDLERLAVDSWTMTVLGALTASPSPPHAQSNIHI